MSKHDLEDDQISKTEEYFSATAEVGCYLFHKNALIFMFIMGLYTIANYIFHIESFPQPWFVFVIVVVSSGTFIGFFSPSCEHH